MLDIVLRIGDVIIVAAAALLAARMRFGHWGISGEYLTSTVRVCLLAIILFPAFNLYRSWRGARLGAEAFRITMAVLTVAVSALALDWALKVTSHYSRIWLGSWFLFALLALITSRILVRGVLGFVRSRGIDMREVVLVGATEAGAKILKAVREHPYMGLRVVGYVATPYDQTAYKDLSKLGDLDTFLAKLEDHVPDQLWIALPMRAEDDIRKLMETTATLHTQMRLVPDFFGYELINHRAGSVAGIPTITLRGSGVDGHARIIKALEDRVLATICLLLASPIMLVLTIAVKLTSRGPVLYRQKRVGLDGREFELLKFRSMPVNTEKDGANWGNAAKKPVTPIGRFMRRTSLDELPQFINVLRGELSMVGPRPERPEFVEKFRREIPGYMQKHLVKGGITGLAQVNGWRGDSSLQKRIECDLHYIQNWSIWLDLKIILSTPFAVLRKTNAY